MQTMSHEGQRVKASVIVICCSLENRDGPGRKHVISLRLVFVPLAQECILSPVENDIPAPDGTGLLW